MIEFKKSHYRLFVNGECYIFGIITPSNPVSHSPYCKLAASIIDFLKNVHTIDQLNNKVTFFRYQNFLERLRDDYQQLKVEKIIDDNLIIGFSYANKILTTHTNQDKDEEDIVINRIRRRKGTINKYFK